MPPITPKNDGARGPGRAVIYHERAAATIRRSTDRPGGRIDGGGGGARMQDGELRRVG